LLVAVEQSVTIAIPYALLDDAKIIAIAMVHLNS